MKLEKAYLGFCIRRAYAFQFRLGSLADTLCECQEGPSTPTQREAEDDPEDEMRARKKRAAAKQREWIEYGCWDRSELSEEGIDKKMCNFLTDLNRDSALFEVRIMTASPFTVLFSFGVNSFHIVD
jgi:hypothetical protein